MTSLFVDVIFLGEHVRYSILFALICKIIFVVRYKQVIIYE